jgi:vacuolar-type H+-ATPase subunit H
MEEEAKSAAGRKTNEAQYEERMVEVYEMILYDTLSFTEFRKEAARRFNITTRQAESLYKDAKDRLKERFSQEREVVLNDQIMRLHDLLKRCRDNNNRKIELETLAVLNKLYNIDSPVKVDVTSGGVPLSINIVLNKE